MTGQRDKALSKDKGKAKVYVSSKEGGALKALRRKDVLEVPHPKKPSMSLAIKEEKLANTHAHVTKWRDSRLVHAWGGADPKKRRCYITAKPHGGDKCTLVLEITKDNCDKTGDVYTTMGELMMSILAHGHFSKQDAKNMFLEALNKP